MGFKKKPRLEDYGLLGTTPDEVIKKYKGWNTKIDEEINQEKIRIEKSCRWIGVILGFVATFLQAQMECLILYFIGLVEVFFAMSQFLLYDVFHLNYGMMKRLLIDIHIIHILMHGSKLFCINQSIAVIEMKQ